MAPDLEPLRYAEDQKPPAWSLGAPCIGFRYFVEVSFVRAPRVAEAVVSGSMG